MRLKNRNSEAWVLTGVTLMLFAPAAYGQACQKKTNGNRTVCSNPGAGCSVAGEGTGSCRTDADAGCECQITHVTNPPSYTLSAAALTPPSLNPSGSATSAIGVTPLNGYSGAVTLSCRVAGQGTALPNCQLNPNVVNIGPGSGTSTLTVTAGGTTPPATYDITITGVDASGLPPGNGSPSVSVALADPMPLKGFVDLHTHPLSNVGFGGKLVYGGVDAGSLLPADPDCNQNVRAANVQQALGHDNSTHGGWGLFDNKCGDILRNQFIHLFQTKNNANDPPDDASGYPDFQDWPKWNDITHQKMWVDWIRRAFGAGLRVMVALAVNNKTTADSVAGPGDGPADDKRSADLQIAETKSFAGRHADFMEIAYTSADLQRIVTAGKLAVVLGVEIDNIGNLNLVNPLSTDAITAEIGRLYDEGVRYIFPIHVIDNPFGGTAVYEDTFNISNFRESGHFWSLECVSQGDPINHIYKPEGSDLQLSTFEIVKLGLIPTNQPPISFLQNISVPANCSGMVNSQGLTTAGIVALKEMMRRGMLIDVDHMSDRSRNTAIAIAQGMGSGYPLNSGHSGLRGFFPKGVAGAEINERSNTALQYAWIGAHQGMAGVGSANLDAYQWVEMYQNVVAAMGSGAIAGFGTDTDGLAAGMPTSSPRYVALTNPGYPGCLSAEEQGTCSSDLTAPQLAACKAKAEGDCLRQYPRITTCSQNCDHPPIEYGPSFPQSTLGNRAWDYNVDGVAHYGMIADFLQAVRSVPGGASLIDNNLMLGADRFYHMWQTCEREKANVQ